MAPRRLTLNDYDITRDGKIINKISGHQLIGQPNAKGYLRVHIDGKLRFIHRLVAEKYIPNPENKDQVNHKDGNKLNNSVDNLEWATNQENRDHAVKNGLHLCGDDCPWSKLTQSDVEFIRQHPNIDDQIYSDILKVKSTTIRDVKNYKTWNHIS